MLLETISKASAEVFNVAVFSFLSIWNAPVGRTGLAKASTMSVKVQILNCEIPTNATELACGPPGTLFILVVPFVTEMNADVSMHPVVSVLSKDASAVSPLNVSWSVCPCAAAHR